MRYIWRTYVRTYSPTEEEKLRCCSTVFSNADGDHYYIVDGELFDSAPETDSNLKLFQSWELGVKKYFNQAREDSSERECKTKMRNDFIREVNKDFAHSSFEFGEAEHPFIKSVTFLPEKGKYDKVVKTNAPFGISKLASSTCLLDVEVRFKNKFPRKTRFRVSTKPKKGRIERNWLVRVILSPASINPSEKLCDEELTKQYAAKVARLNSGRLVEDEKEVYLLFGVKTGLREDRFVLNTEKWKDIELSEETNKLTFKNIYGQSLKILKRSRNMGKFLANKRGIDQGMALVRMSRITYLFLYNSLGCDHGSDASSWRSISQTFRALLYEWKGALKIYCSRTS